MNTRDELRQLQNLPLEVKIQKTKQRIKEWIDYFGEDGVYVSFSGGKDSTVLLNIVREIYPNVPAVFCDTGLEFPEIRDFVEKYDNVEWLKPKMLFKDVVKKYGMPVITKEQASYIYEAKTTKSDKLKELRMNGRNGTRQGMISNKNKYLVDSPFLIGDKCCDIMKKNPAHHYEKSTGRKPMLGVMAQESSFRTQGWLSHGCNAFEATRQVSSPMAFWTEQDVLAYIYVYGLNICTVYKQVVCSNTDLDSKTILSLPLNHPDYPVFKTTGRDRTGCIYCAFGAHLNDDQRFINLKQTHPQIYNYLFKPEEDGGMGYEEKFEWINTNGKIHINY